MRTVNAEYIGRVGGIHLVELSPAAEAQDTRREIDRYPAIGRNGHGVDERGFIVLSEAPSTEGLSAYTAGFQARGSGHTHTFFVDFRPPAIFDMEAFRREAAEVASKNGYKEGTLINRAAYRAGRAVCLIQNLFE